MANDDVMAVDERLSRLETTVATGFHEQGQRLSRLETTVATGFREQGARLAHLEGRMGSLEGRMDSLEGRMGSLEDRMGSLQDRMGSLEDRMFALENKLDVVADSIRADLKTVLEAVTAGTEEMRRTTDAIRKEHHADRRLMMSILDDHSHRLRTLEGRGPAAAT